VAVLARRTQPAHKPPRHEKIAREFNATTTGPQRECRSLKSLLNNLKAQQRAADGPSSEWGVIDE
jgi:hypothetical protein